jgi:hypothetical protein
MRKTSLVLGLLLGLAGNASAQENKAAAPPAGDAPAAMPAPAPSKELADYMKGFEGNWKCDTTWPAGSMGPGSPEVKAKTTVKIKKEFGGLSWAGEYNLPKSKAMPGMKGFLRISYDPASKLAVNSWFDSWGGAGLSAGSIKGQSVTFAGDAYGPAGKMKVRETMELRGPKEAYHKYEADMGKGFTVLGEDICKK